ncbi:MAG TPA: aldolase/citrate lyase family protein, partial [Saprospiraceae bacterium]|nr:aldolase/citrate lyase family protein [Saprospiraceae bacterium]
VPGDRPDLFDKAIAGPSHALILDLEDGVAAASKALARDHVADALGRWAGSERTPVIVRVDPAALEADLSVAVTGGADGVVLAKATSATNIQLLSINFPFLYCLTYFFPSAVL